MPSYHISRITFTTQHGKLKCQKEKQKWTAQRMNALVSSWYDNNNDINKKIRDWKINNNNNNRVSHQWKMISVAILKWENCCTRNVKSRVRMCWVESSPQGRICRETRGEQGNKCSHTSIHIHICTRIQTAVLWWKLASWLSMAVYGYVAHKWMMVEWDSSEKHTLFIIKQRRRKNQRK